MDNIGTKELESTSNKIKILERRIFQFHTYLFERMLEEKQHLSCNIERLWKIIDESKNAIFTPTDLFGFEKLFKTISIASADSDELYYDADVVVFWGHHIDAVRGSMVQNALMHKIEILLMEDGFLRSVYPNVRALLVRIESHFV